MTMLSRYSPLKRLDFGVHSQAKLSASPEQFALSVSVTQTMDRGKEGKNSPEQPSLNSKACEKKRSRFIELSARLLPFNACHSLPNSLLHLFQVNHT
jgi:hypothetical protein